MKDKVQKIKDWISKEQDGLMDAQGNFEYPEHEGAYHILCNLDTYIDSLQEEPTIPDIVDEHYWEMLGEEPQEHVSDDFEKALTEMIAEAQKCVVEPIVVAQQWKDYLVELAKSEEPVSIWHDASEKPNYEENAIIVITSYKGEYIGSRFYNPSDISCNIGVYDKWAYLNDLLNLSNIQRTVKNWKEPVSKELDEEIENYVKRNGYDGLDSIEEVKYIANYFTKWQKLQDMGITNNRAQDVVANILSSADNPLDAYATEVAFMMLPATLKESYHQTNRDRIGDAVKLGAKWKENHLWKHADGDDLPEIDREVIALLDNGKVVLAHRPYKGKYIGKSLTTGNIETFENKTYDKGGWNIPNVKYWLDVELPKEIEL